MKKALAQRIRHMALLIAGGALTGTLLLTLAYCLPTDGIRRHVAASYDSMMMSAEELPDLAFVRWVWRNKETFTDCIMVQYAFEKIPGKNAFEHAMWAYHNDFSDDASWDPELSLGALLNGEDTSQMHLREYSRYWHGYLVWLKPLLLILTWGQTAAFGAILQAGLMAAVCVLAVRKKCPAVAAVMLGGCLFMKLPLMLVSPDMSVCWLITLAALLTLICGQKRLEAKDCYPEFFLCVGMATSFFDFLTYPVVTLGAPLCAFFLLRKGGKFTDDLKRLIGYSFMWVAGYGGLWACKWLIADLTLRTGTIKNALWTVIGITSGISGKGAAARTFGGMHAIELNLMEYDSVIYPVLAVLLAAGALAMIILALCKRMPVFRLLGTVIPYALIACLPFGWIVTAQFHSALHARFTFRIIGVAAMAVCAMTAALWKEIYEKRD